MKFDRIEYQYAASMGPPETLTVQADGQARYESHTAGSRSEIGRYETRLPPAELEALSRVIGDPPLKGLQDHFGLVVAGDRTTRVRMISGTNTVEKMVGTKDPIDTGLSRVIDHLKAIADKVASHPREILRMEAGPLTVDQRSTMTVTLRFSNTGTQPVAWMPPFGRVSVRAWPDKPVADFVPGDLFELRGEQVSCVAETGGSPAAIGPLAPGAEASFRVSAILLPRAPGVHVIQLIYRNTTEQVQGHDVLVGEISARTVKVELTTPAANAR